MVSTLYKSTLRYEGLLYREMTHDEEEYIEPPKFNPWRYIREESKIPKDPGDITFGLVQSSSLPSALSSFDF